MITKDKKKKKLATVMTCVLITTTMLAGCSGGTKTTTEEKVGETASPTAQVEEKIDPLGKITPPIELHVARYVGQSWKFPEGDNVDNNIWSREYESALGIKLINEWTADEGDRSNGSPYNKKLNVSIATDSLPEVFTVTPTQLKQLAEAGSLADLTDVYTKYSTPLTKKLMVGDGGAAINSATFNGKLFALPVITSPIYDANILWIRMDWLQKLNLPEPKTMEDVYKISEAFTNNDPDGNKKNDTYGIGMNKDIYGGVASFGGFANGFHAYPGIWTKDAEGKIVYGSIQPEMKNALAKMQEMYKAGQIDKEFGVKDGGKVGDSIAANKLGMMYGANWNPYWPLNDALKKNPGMEWKPFAAPSIDGTPTKASVGFSTSEYIVVRKNSKHPEAVVKMLSLYQDRSFNKEKYPTTDKENEKFFAFDDNGQRIEAFKFALVSSNVSNNDTIESLGLLREAIQKNDKSIVEKALSEYTKYDAVVKYNKDKDPMVWPQARQFNAFEVIMDSYSGDNLLMNAFGGQTKTMAQKWSSLDALEKETFTKIIMTDGSIDLFDDFVDNWKKLGGDTITKEVNDSLSSQK